jgi:hypothetical protein
MKQCPRCSQTYTDDELNFCLNDGEYLTPVATGQAFQRFADDAPPTVMMDPTRVTNPTNWPVSQPQPQGQWPQPVGQQQAFAPYPMTMSPNQTLAIVSICLGAGSITIGWCCSLGLVLGPAALITGFIALSQNKKDPQTYGGRGMAIGGIVMGGVFLLCYIILIVIYGAAVFFSALSGGH